MNLTNDIKLIEKDILLNWWIHVLFWNAYVFIAFNAYLIEPKSINTFDRFIDVYVHNLLAISVCFYLQFFLLLKMRGWWKLSSFILIFTVFTILRITINDMLLRWGVTASSSKSTTTYLDGFIIYFFFGGMGTGFYFAINTIKKQEVIFLLEKDNLNNDIKIQEEKIHNQQLLIENQKSEMSRLNSQINPHFLFNTLNFFYSEIRLIHPKISESILLLSDIMRYSLIENHNVNLVPVEGEINHIRNYIDLQKNRYNDIMNLSLSIVGESNSKNKTIPPMILLTLIENIFKYGDLFNIDEPCQINIIVEEDQLLYQSVNKVQLQTSNLPPTQLGQNNLKSRLRMVYGKENFLFKTDVKNNLYHCNLTIKY
jgi:two-component system LytT family sensor kinase